MLVGEFLVARSRERAAMDRGFARGADVPQGLRNSGKRRREGDEATRTRRTTPSGSLS